MQGKMHDFFDMGARADENGFPMRHSEREHRLCAKGDFGKFVSDLKEFHARTDGPLETVGSAVMLPAVALTKVGNAIAGEFSDQEAPELREGAFKYTGRDIRSLMGNAGAAVKNLLTLHPVKAAGNVLKGTFDALDLTVDPFLDIGSSIVGHQNRATRSRIAALAA